MTLQGLQATPELSIYSFELQDDTQLKPEELTK